MKKHIYKYYIKSDDHLSETELNLPDGAKLLKIGEQYEALYGWFECRDAKDVLMENRFFVCMYTGEEFDDTDLEHRETVVIKPTFVVHIYEKKPFLNSEDVEI